MNIVSNKFNYYFMNVGKTLAAQIPKAVLYYIIT